VKAEPGEEALATATGDAAVRHRALGCYLAAPPQVAWKRMLAAVEVVEEDMRWTDLFGSPA
jgi:hypothetical protein